MNRNLIAAWMLPVALAAWLVHDLRSWVQHKESRKAGGPSPLGLPTREANHASSGAQSVFAAHGSDDGEASSIRHPPDGPGHGQRGSDRVRPVGPQESVVLERMKRLQEEAPAVYAEIVSNLMGGGVNIASAGVVAPSVYGDLQRLRMFEEFRSNYEHELNDTEALDAIPQSKESREDYIFLIKRGMEVWGKVVAAQRRSIIQRIAVETGVTGNAMIESILSLRPHDLLPDSYMTNGILRR